MVVVFFLLTGLFLIKQCEGQAQCNFQLYSDPLEGVLLDALGNRDIVCTPDQSLPDRVACSLANPCTCVMQDGVTAIVVSTQCPRSPLHGGRLLMRFHAALIPTGSCLSAELPQSPQAGILMCSMDVLSLMVPGVVTQFAPIDEIGCTTASCPETQCDFQLYSDPLEGVLLDALGNRDIVCTPDQSLPDRVECSLANPCTCVMQDGVTARVVSTQCPRSPLPDGPQLMRFHAALIPTGSCLSAELPQSPQEGVLSCSMDVLSLMVPGVVTQFAPIDEVGCMTASCPAP